MLWFAFKFRFLNRYTQRAFRRFDERFSCDLLSNSDFWIGTHNYSTFSSSCVTVVICFQIPIFESVHTTEPWACDAKLPLWFAFKFRFLNRYTQRIGVAVTPRHSCDLLSNSDFWIGTHNATIVAATDERVVICFQIPIFESVHTTPTTSTLTLTMLWFAFKFRFLNRYTQRLMNASAFAKSCDLLSNSDFWIGTHNPRQHS